MHGVIIVLDLDRFRKIVEEMGWSEYSPNPITGLLSNLVEELVHKHHAMVVYGLDWKGEPKRRYWLVPAQTRVRC